MKKTEKIEIRISHEDKARLTEKAARDNKTVSDLIRDLGNDYIDSTQPKRGPLQGLLSLATLTITLCVGAGAALLTPVVFADGPDPYYLSALTLPNDTRPSVRSGLSIDPDREPPYYVLGVNDLTMPGLTLRIDFRPSKVADGQALVVLCGKPDTTCDQIAEDVITYDEGNGGETLFDVHNDLKLEVVIRPRQR